MVLSSPKPPRRPGRLERRVWVNIPIQEELIQKIWLSSPMPLVTTQFVNIIHPAAGTMLGDSMVDQELQTGAVVRTGKGMAWWSLHGSRGQNRCWELPTAPLLLVGIKHANEIPGLRFSWPDCWRDWLHYSFLMKRFLGLSRIHRDYTRKKKKKEKNSRVINRFIYLPFFQNGLSQRIHGAWTENGLVVRLRLEALCFIGLGVPLFVS